VVRLQVRCVVRHGPAGLLTMTWSVAF